MERFVLAFGLVLAACSSPAGGGPDCMEPLPDMAGQPPPKCGADGAACTVGGQQALCRGDACSLCTDVDDDAACAAAYGAGNICAGGVCKNGCHDDSACAGQVCDSGSCRACTQDGDCTSNPAGTSCDTSTGLCGAPQACTSGTACAGGFCCSALCYPVDTGETGCCQDSDCGAGQKCSASHTCYSSTNCTTPFSGSKIYVDPAAVAGMRGVGTTQCPFVSLDSALQALPTISGAAPSSTNKLTVCTKGTFDSVNDKLWPRLIPAWVTLDGNYCGATTTHTVLKVPNGNSGIFFVGNGDGGIHGYDIIEKGTKSSAGIFVSNTGTNTVAINDVTINNFVHGIHVTQRAMEKVGNVHITHDTDSSMNTTGLLVDAGGVADIQVQAMTATRAQFDSNSAYGIRVDDGTLTVEGAVFTGTGSGPNTRTVRANMNGQDGIYIASGKANVTLDHFSSSNNSYNGLSVIAPASLKVHNSVFLNNTLNGLHVWGSTGATVANLGFGSSGNLGNNVFANNSQTGLCVDSDVTGDVYLVGNTFNNGDTCSSGLTVGFVCAVNSDVAYPTAAQVHIGSSCVCSPAVCSP
jgi:hypothetical protein